jgi:hypothetical protein
MSALPPKADITQHCRRQPRVRPLLLSLEGVSRQEGRSQAFRFTGPLRSPSAANRTCSCAERDGFDEKASAEPHTLRIQKRRTYDSLLRRRKAEFARSTPF